MDREIQLKNYELTIHPITDARLIEFRNEQKEKILVVPMEMFAVMTFFRSLFKQESFAAPAHRMFTNMIQALGGKILKVIIDDLQGGRFFASIYYTRHEGEVLVEKAEASDALAIAFCAASLVYTTESVIEAAKNDRANRVYWYNPEDKEMMKRVRALSHKKLADLPNHDIEQLLEIAAKIEDFEFAARLKKAQDAQEERVRQITEILNSAERPKSLLESIKEMTEEFRNSMNKDMKGRIEVDLITTPVIKFTEEDDEKKRN